MMTDQNLIRAGIAAPYLTREQYLNVLGHIRDQQDSGSESPKVYDIVDVGGELVPAEFSLNSADELVIKQQSASISVIDVENTASIPIITQTQEDDDVIIESDEMSEITKLFGSKSDEQPKVQLYKREDIEVVRVQLGNALRFIDGLLQ